MGGISSVEAELEVELKRRATAAEPKGRARRPSDARARDMVLVVVESLVVAACAQVIAPGQRRAVEVVDGVR